jgi:hypothetical protein
MRQVAALMWFTVVMGSREGQTDLWLFTHSPNIETVSKPHEFMQQIPTSFRYTKQNNNEICNIR